MAETFTPPTSLPTAFDPTFRDVGKTAGLTVWRVEQLKVVRKNKGDECHKGVLYDGDSYIFLNVESKGASIERNIFFWLGAHTSQDEMGVAAYKTVELDESMGGTATQHREVQGGESDEFRRLFPNGIQYEKGGVATGFRHVDPNDFEKRLLHVAGRRQITVVPVEASGSSMNTGDVFIADGGRAIVMWCGEDSSHVEKHKALQICRRIRDDERGGDAKIHIVEQGADDDKIFWDTLGVPKSYVQKPPKTNESERKQLWAKLYKISDASGSVKMTEVASANLKKDMLQSDDCFLLDVFGQIVYIWVGKTANKNERLHAMRMGTDFLKSKGYKNTTPIKRVVENAEPAMFKSYFDVWRDPEESDLIRKKQKSKSFVKRMFSKTDMHKMKTREEEAMVDDGQSGKVNVWRIHDFKKVAVAEDQFGQFHSGDSYIVQYIYKMDNGREGYLIYFWLGLHTTQDEAGSAALLTKELDDSLQGQAVQIRVTQGHEPRHFLQIFKGKFVIHAGGVGSGFKNRSDKDVFDNDGTRLYHVHGYNSWAIRAVQVPERASSLNSADCFVFVTPGGNYLWFGNHSTGDERELAKTILPVIADAKTAKMVVEGKEPAEFWGALVGGKGPYQELRIEEGEYRQARLFQASNARGYFFVEEIPSFQQDDLIADDVMILDTFREVFVWVGSRAKEEERKDALKCAIEYIKSDPTGRNESNTTILQIRQGCEPPSFTVHFSAWDSGLWDRDAGFAELKKSVSGIDPVAASEALKAFEVRVIPYAQLSGKQCPEGVDPLAKEKYLSAEEFQKYLGMTLSEFERLPEWKAKKLKQKAKLY